MRVPETAIANGLMSVTVVCIGNNRGGRLRVQPCGAAENRGRTSLVEGALKHPPTNGGGLEEN